MKRVAILLGVAMAAPLAAQEIAIDGHRIDRCLAIHEEPALCVGREAYDCIVRNGGGADMVIAACQEAEGMFWDRALNEAYGDLLRLARGREASDAGDRPGALVHGLREMQRAWIAYRDATCNAAMARARPFGHKM